METGPNKLVIEGREGIDSILHRHPDGKLKAIHEATSLEERRTIIRETKAVPSITPVERVTQLGKQAVETLTTEAL